MPLAGLPALACQPELRFNAEQPLSPDEPARLLLVCAADCRFEATLEVEAPWAAWRAQVDATFPSVAQRLYLELPAAVAARLHAEPLTVRSAGPEPLWLIAPETRAASLAPQVLSGQAADPLGAALDRLAEPALAPFGWMGGCVLEALAQAARGSAQGTRYARALEAWLDCYLTPAGFAYDSARSERLAGRFESIETTLPVAAIARVRPGHPALDAAVDFWNEARKADGSVRDHSFTAEGSYTVAYPMLVLGRQRGEARLIEDAWRQLRMRREELVHSGDLYLRCYDGKRSFRNWTRGIAWYLLGLTQGLIEADSAAPADLRAHLAERAAWIAARQRPDGLWDNFLDEPGPPPDASGSCGIAAALLNASKAGLLQADCRNLAERALKGALGHVQADGYLGSVAPNNKRGEEHQHTQRRTCEPFALGLLGQLAAALGHA